MAENTLSTCINSITENTTQRYYNKSYYKKNFWKVNENFNYTRDYNYNGQRLYDGTSSEFKKNYTTIDNNLTNISIADAFCLPSSYQMPMERFYKILCTVTMIGNTTVGSSLSLTRNCLIDKANEIIKKVCLVPKDDTHLLKSLDIQLQEIEEVTTNMAHDMGLKVVSTKSVRTLKAPQNTIINMMTYKNLSEDISCEPVLISDDKNVLVKRNYNCINVGDIQVEIIKKIYITNCNNVNILEKLLGPRGNIIKDLENATQSKITISGKGSMSNFIMEEDLFRQRVCENFNEPLNIVITIRDTSEVECYRKLEYLRKQLIYILCQKEPIVGCTNR